jgi:catechol 2,3-dioxygenase-like lactoylglutathione lyase family enzyme
MSDTHGSPSNGAEAHHIGLTVADIDRSVGFYTDVLGCTVDTRFSVSGDAFETAVGTDGVSGRFVHLDSGGSRIELVEYEPAGPPREPATLPQPGGSHVAFSVDDVDAFLEGLPDRIDRLSEPRTTDSGTRLVFVRDPDGNLVELLEA